MAAILNSHKKHTLISGWFLRRRRSRKTAGSRDDSEAEFELIAVPATNDCEARPRDRNVPVTATVPVQRVSRTESADVGQLTSNAPARAA